MTMTNNDLDVSTNSYILDLSPDIPDFFNLNSVALEVRVGSYAYGASNDESDVDILGFCFPHLQEVFPERCGYIHGFDLMPNFEQYLRQHVYIERLENSADITIYNIIKFFKLLSQGNPNVLEVLFAPEDCIMHSSRLGQYVMSQRHSFLSWNIHAPFTGFAKQQMRRFEEGKADRTDLYHSIRLLFQARDVLNEGDMNLRKYQDILSSVRNGDLSEEATIEMFNSLLREADEAFDNTSLPDPTITKARIREVLDRCIRSYYGSII